MIKMEQKSTPANRWSEEGKEDPFKNYNDLERANLTLGDYTDDELANAVFLNGNHTPPFEEILNGTAKMPIVYLTAAKERIRWLSRKLTALENENAELKAKLK